MTCLPQHFLLHKLCIINSLLVPLSGWLVAPLQLGVFHLTKWWTVGEREEKEEQIKHWWMCQIFSIYCKTASTIYLFWWSSLHEITEYLILLFLFVWGVTLIIQQNVFLQFLLWMISKEFCLLNYWLQRFVPLHL